MIGVCYALLVSLWFQGVIFNYLAHCTVHVFLTVKVSGRKQENEKYKSTEQNTRSTRVIDKVW